MALDTNLPVFARPIEIHSANKTFEVTSNSNAESLSLTEGTYANLAALLIEFSYQYDSHADAGGDATLNSDLKVEITCSSPGTTTIVWTHTALRDLLGFDEGVSVSDGNPQAGDYMSPYL